MLLAVDDAALRDVTTAYAEVYRRLIARLDELGRDIAKARRQHVEVRPGWLFAQERYRVLIGDMEEHIAQFAGTATAKVQLRRRAAAMNAAQAMLPLTIAALGPGPREAEVIVAARFTRLANEALDRLIERASDGRPLGALFAEIAPGAVTEIRDALAYGVAAGRPVREIARQVRDAARIPLTRALSISRNEVVGSYRDASLASMRSSQVVRGWIWFAQPDARTCAVCWAQHGSEHPDDEPMGSHPQCRCAMLPRTVSWAELGYTGIPDRRPGITAGPTLFARLARADQLEVLGPGKFDAYKAGALGLEDLVRPTQSGRWGPGLREASLRELVPA